MKKICVKDERFIKMPNMYSQCSIKDTYNISRKFYIIYIILARYKTLENISWLPIEEILTTVTNNNDYDRAKKNEYKEIINVINFMQESNMIKVVHIINSKDNLLDNIRYNSLLKVRIIEENFCPTTNWSKVYLSDFDKIMNSNFKTKKEIILSMFLYVNSYILERNSQEMINNPYNYPSCFCQEIRTIVKAKSNKASYIKKYMEILQELDLLEKHVTGSYSDKKGNIRNAPNIYVIKRGNYKQEIFWMLNILKKRYNVTRFNKPTNKTKGETKQNEEYLRKENCKSCRTA